MTETLMNSQERDQVRTIVQKELDQLDQGFRQRPEIIVHREVDELDDDEVVYIHIKIIFDGDQNALDPYWMSGLIMRLRTELLKIGLTEFPIPSFIEKTEWDQWQRRNRRRQLIDSRGHLGSTCVRSRYTCC